jgi:glutathione S-transferase
MMRLVHARVVGEEIPTSMKESAAADFGDATRRLEERLDGRRWIVSEEMTAADITCAAVIYRIRSSGVLPWSADLPRSEGLTDRVMALLD